MLKRAEYLDSMKKQEYRNMWGRFWKSFTFSVKLWSNSSCQRKLWSEESANRAWCMSPETRIMWNWETTAAGILGLLLKLANSLYSCHFQREPPLTGLPLSRAWTDQTSWKLNAVTSGINVFQSVFALLRFFKKKTSYAVISAM